MLNAKWKHAVQQKQVVIPRNYVAYHILLLNVNTLFVLQTAETSPKVPSRYKSIKGNTIFPINTSCAYSQSSLLSSRARNPSANFIKVPDIPVPVECSYGTARSNRSIYCTSSGRCKYCGHSCWQGHLNAKRSRSCQEITCFLWRSLGKTRGG